MAGHELLPFERLAALNTPDPVGPGADDFDYAAALADCAQRQTGNIAAHTLDNGQRVWVRRAGPRNPAWRYRLLGGVARLLRLTVLTPVPNLGGEQGIATEARRLQQLAAAGVAVPPLLAQQPDALMMGNIGQHNLLREWHNHAQQPEALLQRWQWGLSALAEVHRKRQYLSQAFARNIMYHPPSGELAFIDFEDDPGSVLPLAVCQARDWLCYLHSGALILQQAGILTAAIAAWRQQLASAEPAVADTVGRALRYLRPLRRLRHPRWGKDSLRLAAMARFAEPPS